MQAECDLRVAQSEFDRQAEITKLLLEGISTSQSSHLRHLHAFVEAQVENRNKISRVLREHKTFIEIYKHLIFITITTNYHRIERNSPSK